MQQRLEKNIDAAQCVPSVWTAFAENLAQVLAGLQEDQYLILEAKRSNRYIQFAGQGAYGLRMETTSNHYLLKSDQLTEQQIALLTENGWNSPTRDPRESSPEDNPEGSPNFFINHPLPVAYETVANLTVRTFDTILRVTHPGWLEYDALDADSNSFSFPSLGIKRRIRLAGKDPNQVRQRLLASVQEFTNLNDLAFDQDGDIAIRVGTAIVFIRYQTDPPMVRLHSPLVLDVETSPALLARLNELNKRGYLHFFFDQGRVIAAADVNATPFITQHVGWMLKTFFNIVDDVDDLLVCEFG
ncbi:T3SS (YopN, CesT) and YbjN peptide-binding chaperone 1, partial [Desulfonatronum parangueonense]